MANDVPSAVWWILGALFILITSVITGVIYATFGSSDSSDGDGEKEPPEAPNGG